MSEATMRTNVTGGQKKNKRDVIYLRPLNSVTLQIYNLVSQFRNNFKEDAF